MSISMSARCDTKGCLSLQAFSMESPEETGDTILEGLREGGWGVEGTFSPIPKSVKLACPYCVKKRGLLPSE